MNHPDSHDSPGPELPRGTASVGCMWLPALHPGAALTQAGNHPPMGASPVSALEGVVAQAGLMPSSITVCTGSAREQGYWARGQQGCSNSLTHPGQPSEPQPKPTKQTKGFLALKLPGLEWGCSGHDRDGHHMGTGHQDMAAPPHHVPAPKPAVINTEAFSHHHTSQTTSAKSQGDEPWER